MYSFRLLRVSKVLCLVLTPVILLILLLIAIFNVPCPELQTAQSKDNVYLVDSEPDSKANPQPLGVLKEPLYLLPDPSTLYRAFQTPSPKPKL